VRPVDAGVKKVLPRYFEILRAAKNARFLIAKKLNINLDLSSMSTDALWEAHTQYLDEFYSTLSATDMEKLDLSDSALASESASSINLIDLKLELAKRLYRNCAFCERNCRVDRTKKLGHCKVGNAKVASEFIHWGEEAELVPSYTIFFAGCTFHCVYCQNWDISQSPENGVTIAPQSIAKLITHRWKADKVKNTNWVGGDPTSNLAYIIESLTYLKINIPQVWNSNMYLSELAMKLLDGVIDVYLTDFKYGNNKCAERLSKVKRYWDVVTRNHKLANKQCELIIRHLVLPEHLDCCTKPILRWIADNLDTTRVRVNVMDQYHPDYKAHEYNELRRVLKSEEFNEALSYANGLGLVTGSE
jgi:putative pyruvate formate lyase activating enzyme